MKIWSIDKANCITQKDRDGVLGGDLVKVKVTATAITHSDIALLAGKNTAKLPIVPGRIAVGLVSETADDFGLRKGERVLLNPYRKDKICGMDIDGYLGDYAIVPLSCVHTLPEGISDDTAIFAEHIAMAIRCLDKLKVEQGEYVAILGTNHFCLLLAQLVDYYHGIPVIVGSDDNGLQAARDIGITYVIDTRIQDAVARVNLITNGVMCDCTVLEAAACPTPQLALALAKVLGRVCVVGLDSYIGKVTVDIRTVMDKRLTVIGATNGGTNIPSAINLLATGALFTKHLHLDYTDWDNVDQLMLSLVGQDYNGLTVCRID